MPKKTRAWLFAKFYQIAMGFWPPLLGAAIKVKHISTDFKVMRVQMKLHWYNKNLHGTHFGGSIFSMTDPFYILMFSKNLGPDYIVWDKAAEISYIKPGKKTLFCDFCIEEQEVDEIRVKVEQNKKYIFTKKITVVDSDKNIVAEALRTIYVKKKQG